MKICSTQSKNDHSITVETRNLTRVFGEFTAVDNINLSVHKGEIFGFLGPNGAGKSTTIRMLCGILAPTSGSAYVLGYSAQTEQEMIRQSIGYMSQKFSLFNDLTIQENLDFFGALYGLQGKELKKQSRQALDTAHLIGREKTITSNLPAGIKQRLALAAATLHNPSILFLDEPTSGVDPDTRQNFWKLIYEYSAQGSTIFVTTHYMDEAEHCNRIALIAAGKVIALDTPAGLKKNLTYTIYSVSSHDYLNIFHHTSRMTFIVDRALFGRDIHLLVHPGKERKHDIELFIKKYSRAPFTVKKTEPTLEDVFVLNTRRHS